MVEDSWKCGFVHVGEINKDSARYMTNYVTKFMNFEKSKKLNGRHPEFARMSNRPGIGAPAMVHIAEELKKSGYSNKTIVNELHYGNRHMPLGAYLTRSLHKGRKGDILAEFHEGRSRLLDNGIEYIGWLDNRGMVQGPGDSDDGVVFYRSNDDGGSTTRDHNLSKGKGKRFKIEANRRQFRQKRSI